MNCPTCGEATIGGAKFCEACGSDLTPQPEPLVPCVSCAAAGDQILDGYCMECGHKQPGPRDHVEVDLGVVAGASDKGQRHRTNEDSMAFVTVGQAVIMVVCDGVSTTDNSDLASQAAADAALAVLVAAAEADGSDEALDGALVAAAAAAQEAVLSVPILGQQGNPSCTLVAAVVRPGIDGAAHVHVGWLGDSRAYWFGQDGEAKLVTTDHSWATEMAASGALSEAEAMAHPRAHTITRWLGADAPTIEPEIVHVTIPRSATVLLCSDGLWNYAPAADVLAARPEWGEPTLALQSRALTAFANASGGHDNITVVIAKLDAANLSNEDGSAQTVPSPDTGDETNG